uniref:Chromatin-remodeling ATPase INO80 n=1 Tax=Clastoptera arizonana TaxID=38151 RepID=A0A1B6DCW5_9HEMI
MINKDIAKPLHFQQLERSLNIHPFLSYVENVFKEPIGDATVSSESEAEENPNESEQNIEENGVRTTKQDRRSDRMRLYNFAHVQSDRVWLQNILVSDSSDSSDCDKEDEPISEQYLQNMLKLHHYKKKCQQKFYSNPDNRQYQYYGAGLLSNYDKFQEHQTLIVGNKKKKKCSSSKKEKKKSDEKESFGDCQDQDQLNEDILNELKFCPKPSSSLKSSKSKKKVQQGKSPEIMAHRRRKIWAVMAKKEVAKVQRSKTNNHKEVVTGCRRVAQYCMRYWRQKAMQSQKNMKETLWRAKRLAREMQAYWRKFDRVERETKRRMEKEAEEQRKMDVELMEAKRQQRKLNFLITQTELYAHFMSRKLGGTSAEEQLRILSQLEEEKNPRLATIDDYDSEVMKEKVKQNVHNAFHAEEAKTRKFCASNQLFPDPPEKIEVERPQPSIFVGSLKHYQLKGMNWLANLYDQGINGILADEMGLGKTVQSIAFLCHIAEKYSVWGPFLIISPASTLHNWQQEMARFVPAFKVVPYWGSPQERKILRQFWNQKDLHTQDASFHVVITSYQLVIADFKYFTRIKWQYLILDEAQAIKSAGSNRWKQLLGFSCRNRLLLSGTPIQNSMAELWALLHFIMPTLFDSHDEFNEWFSKDIESHAENKTSIDEKHLSRLHMILKPFMLRRIKKDVENELSDKIEVMVYCPLTTRQKILYSALKKKIRIEDLLHSSGPYQSSQSIASSLMNLVMQFRKVCNHPELFERREAKSPFFMMCSNAVLIIPKLVFEECLLNRMIPSKDHLLYNKFSILQPENVYRSECFAFIRLSRLSPADVYELTIGGLLFRWLNIICQKEEIDKHKHRAMWWDEFSPSLIIYNNKVPADFLFTAREGNTCVFSFTNVVHHSMAETIEHRLLRSRKSHSSEKSIEQSPSKNKTSEDNQGAKVPILPEFSYRYRPPRVLNCHPSFLPSFVYNSIPKIRTNSWQLYCSNRAFAWWWMRHTHCSSKKGLDAIWFGSTEIAAEYRTAHTTFQCPRVGGLTASTPLYGWSNIAIPDKQMLVTDAGKLFVLDGLLKKLKEQGHRVLIYSQMTRMIDLLEEYMWFRKLTYMRLDGSSKISERRDMVADFQSRADIFVFLLSTRAGGLGINLTAADTVIFYDSDWNPTVDQQAMDRAHRLGQTKQVTVYRLICKNTIEERILQRAREKSEIQRMVISGGNFKPDSLKPKEVVSLLLDDEEIEKKYRQKQAERRQVEENRADMYKERDRERKRKQNLVSFKEPCKQLKFDEGYEESIFTLDSAPTSPAQSEGSALLDDTSSDALVVDVDGPIENIVQVRHSSKRGRPRRCRGASGGVNRSSSQITLPGSNITSPRSVALRRGPGRPRLRPGPSLRGSPRQRGPSRGSLSSLPTTVSEPIKPFGYYTQDLEITPLDPDVT